MVVGICVFELHLPQAQSLKQKRKVVKSLIERIHQRFRLSIAETGFHDLHQRAEISLAAIVQSGRAGEQLMEAVRNLIDQQPEAMIVQWDPQFLEGVR